MLTCLSGQASGVCAIGGYEVLNHVFAGEALILPEIACSTMEVVRVFLGDNIKDGSGMISIFSRSTNSQNLNFLNRFGVLVQPSRTCLRSGHFQSVHVPGIRLHVGAESDGSVCLVITCAGADSRSHL